ncbi:MAG: acyl-CoA thioesterase [Cephaloticoccus sp.]|nr:acyl-CoA thioesterase [Cephaloticoccus sp.]MCF7758904.1 acyl-CoA thioesterase [Cephaloticoccus sp.]
MNVYSKFETELAVRPDDIDLYQHVHSTRYLDYVLAARFEQMERYYGMSMQDFARLGLGWFMTTANIAYKRPLGWGDRMTVRCWIEHFTTMGCRVAFEIEKLPTGKRVCDGFCDYMLVNLTTGRGVTLPEDIKAKYSI